LSLIYGSAINNRGEIAGQAVDQSGNSLAFLAIPCDEEHSDNKECEDGAEGPTDVSQRLPTIPPENIREQLWQRRGFRPSAAGRVSPER
jgi:hypothetical protein